MLACAFLQFVLSLVVGLNLLSSNRKQFLYFWRIHHMPQADSWLSWSIVVVIVAAAATMIPSGWEGNGGFLIIFSSHIRSWLVEA